MSASATSSVLALALILLSLYPAHTSATTYRVPDDYPTIAAANDIASPGDTILVLPGVHDEPDIVYLKSGLRLLGGGGDRKRSLFG